MSNKDKIAITLSLNELETKFLEALIIGADNMAKTFPAFAGLTASQGEVRQMAIEISRSILTKIEIARLKK